MTARLILACSEFLMSWKVRFMPNIVCEVRFGVWIVTGEN